jgi:hypothetical protein
MEPKKPSDRETLWLRDFRKAKIAELVKEKAGNAATEAGTDDKTEPNA